ncbi:TIM-barrel domain-containing protein [Terriglobus sp.]|uniref:glycoside hydrolase family 31 protein n=1 Tax=Terriglobus sp. TaxID=1889013 RepID=UPI003B001DFC
MRVAALLFVLPALWPALLWAQGLQLDRSGATVTVTPYAANIVHVTLSLRREDALAGPGYGISARADSAGWSAAAVGDAEVLRSALLSVRVTGRNPRAAETGKLPETAKYFSGSAPYVGLSIVKADGSMLLELHGWQMAPPNYKDATAWLLNDRRPGDAPFFTVGATFSAAPDEHDYGMGQNQEAYLDRRGHTLRCAHDYNAPGGESVCVPFVVTNKGYALLWDNPSRTTATFGLNSQNTFTSEVGQRVSFFVIAGDYRAQYRGYRLLTGDVPMLPRSAYGYIQCKQRYSSQDELLAVAHGYRERHLPADDLVIDWFHYTKMGEMDMDPAQWPDPIAMNRELHGMHFHTMISVWPRFVPEDRYYKTVLDHGWFEHLADGTPTNGLPFDKAGSDIDTTNPDAAKWYWQTIRDNYVAKGFDSFWADETEPDLPPNGSYFHVGPGTAFFNIYPLFHTGAIYTGMRADMHERALILARASYLGAQHNGTIFWSSGMPYWSTDIGGWQGLPARHTPAHKPLLDPSDARDVVGGYDDYPELYTRWFEYGTFQPNMRTHGTRPQNEVWSYGKQAEPILEKYLRLRYALLPYLYSLGWHANQTGEPFMRGLFLDFGSDPNVADIGDEYMFGPALLVAPITEQGATWRSVYLPAGTDWYNFWTNERVHGGQRVTVAAPIDTIPVFVRAGSIVPMGSAVESTEDKQSIAEVRVYPGADGSFTLYNDDGKTYAYEHGEFETTELRWSDAAGKLMHTGAKAWSGSDASVVKVVH